MRLDLSYMNRLRPSIPPENLPAHQEYVRYHQRRFAVSIEMLRPVLSPHCKVLSVGIEPGYFEAYLTSEYECRMSGTELAKFHAEGFRYDIVYEDRLHNRNVTVPVTMGEAGRSPLPYANSAFDLVLFLEVIEHLLCRPNFAVSELYRVTRPGGHLLLSTPNAQHWCRIAYLLAGRRYPDTEFRDEDPSSRHHQLFSKLELVELLEAVGFSIMESRFEDCYDLAQAEFLDKFPVLRPIATIVECEKENIFILARRGNIDPHDDSFPSQP
jgi:SAM-dependent methyltransferase